MKYYLSVDAGGTKIASVLFNEEYQICGVGYGGGVNTNFETMDKVREHIEQTICEVLKGTEVQEIQHVYFAGPGPMEIYEEGQEIRGHRKCGRRR
jgi:N-acetylglucosamine kinase-like BadF-type ATPase